MRGAIKERERDKVQTESFVSLSIHCTDKNLIIFIPSLHAEAQCVQVSAATSAWVQRPAHHWGGRDLEVNRGHNNTDCYCEEESEEELKEELMWCSDLPGWPQRSSGCDRSRCCGLRSEDGGIADNIRYAESLNRGANDRCLFIFKCKQWVIRLCTCLPLGHSANPV